MGRTRAPLQMPDVVTYKQEDGTKYERNKTVKQVIIGADVTETAKSAFRGCKNLASLELSLRCKKIGQGAFAGTALTSWVISSN